MVPPALATLMKTTFLPRLSFFALDDALDDVSFRPRTSRLAVLLVMVVVLVVVFG